MNTKDAKELIERYQAGMVTPEEVALIEQWVMLGKVKELDLSEDELAEDFLMIRNGLPLKYEEKRLRLWPRIVAISPAWKIAAAVAAMTLGVWLYYTSSMNGRHLEGSTATRGLYTNDIAPGRNTATITFDDGEAIALNNKELSISSESVEPLKEDSEASSEKTQFLASRISRSKTIVLSTPRGGTYQVTLPDGTRVWLNADTKIEFPSQFSSTQRKVLLTSGEAYFEVSKNKAKPFIVQTDKQEVTVLGTHFNISAYPDEGSSKTTLLEGSVSVSSLRGKRSDEAISQGEAVKLKPNQQAVLTATNTIQVKQIDPEQAVAWKNGYFRFKEENLASIMRQLSKWYNIEVMMDAADGKKQFTGKISRNNNISEVLMMLEQTKDVKFKVEGRRVTVIK